ncbi:molybdopterin-binding protein [Noviherbaspirillum cavernae]|uniref:Molybdopterin-binding protein n=1 Tax=Noviherbaspirillum cavernae TaxID=2320862 RepID=A0A418WW70_9BURK|nr:molybdopterin-binding protein [Noviherbaspirillum cavernae]RJF96972.1 molybdopterin-binding protein [Noviherbaspirillum cavernae]
MKKSDPSNDPARRKFLLRALAACGSVLLAGCDRLSRTEWFPPILKSAEKLTQAAQKLVTPRASMAQEFDVADLSPTFRSNGTANPSNRFYQMLVANGFATYQLKVSGLVAHPRTFSLEELRALPSRTQITRHDCVEGWSAIGKWKGARLSALLDSVAPTPEARYVVFYCADPMDEAGTKYYESIDMDDAYHLQTLLAYELNDKALPVANGAPVRLRVERQLGYKMPKYIMALELVSSFDKIGGGKGGYWEDEGYEWYAGI